MSASGENFHMLSSKDNHQLMSWPDCKIALWQAYMMGHNKMNASEHLPPIAQSEPGTTNLYNTNYETMQIGEVATLHC